MKAASPALIALLSQARQFVMADLYTLQLVDGTLLRYAEADLDVRVDTRTFSGSGPRFERGSTRVAVGLEVDSLTVSVFADATHQLAGVPFLQAATSGALDGAQLTLERAFMAEWGDTSPGTVVLFAGRVAESEVDRTQARLTIRSDVELLNIKLPRNIYQPGCGYTLFDTGCTLSKAAWGVNTSIAAGSTRSVLKCGLTQADGWFELGTIAFASGPNAGVRRTVKRSVVGELTLSYPLPKTPFLGDSFIAYAGCDKRESTCSAKFNNTVAGVARFRGFPDVPVPETAI